MADAIFAYPEQRNPNADTPLHGDGEVTVLYQNKRITLNNAIAGEELLIEGDDLAKVNGFELKPEGACFEEVCIPTTDEMWSDQDGRRLFNLTAFARHMGQAYVSDAEAGAYSFAEMPSRRDNMMVDGMAPDFELKDRQGKVVRREDLKGKKALIVTWSSW